MNGIVCPVHTLLFPLEAAAGTNDRCYKSRKYSPPLSRQPAPGAGGKARYPGDLSGMVYLCGMSFPGTNPFTKTEAETDVLTAEAASWQLIVWNDEVNTFEWVIETLMEVCGHTYEQAEQCSYIIHFKGKYAVKEGMYEDLEPMCSAILDRGISATIEELVS